MQGHQGYEIRFSAMLPDNKGHFLDNVIYMPESMVYKIIFMNNDVSDQNVKFAINYAIQKVNRFIDNYKA